jgi:DNA-binding transcriptional regulator YiaG
MQGFECRALRKSLEISGAELARELGIKPASLRDTEGAAKLQLKTETRIMAALAVIARRQAAARRRSATEALLAGAAT